MQYILEGIILGLTLSVLLGPIFIVLIQSSLENGSKAGFIAASGIWFSDILFVVLGLQFVKKIAPYTESNQFIYWVGLIGGVVLIGVGIATAFKKGQLTFENKPMGRTGMFSYWIKGFMVNTVNPFSFIFWLSTITASVASRQLAQGEGWLFAGSIIITIIITDSLKVLLAKIIRNRITVNRLTLINRIAGIALIISGVILLLRSVV